MRQSVAMIALGLSAGAVYAEVPRVAVDIAPVHSIVATIMDGVGTPDLITPPGTSPHNHQMRPSEARALDQADIVVWVGHALTPWLEGPVETLAEGTHTIELMDLSVTSLLDIREGAAFGAHNHDHGGEEDHDDHAAEGKDDHGHDDHGHEDEEHAHDDHAGEDKHDDHAHDDHAGEDKHDDHAHDDHAEGHDDHDADHAGHDDHEDHAGHDDHAGHADHGPTDPHVWLDPANAAAWANVIAAELSEHDPENASTYFSNASAFIADMQTLEGEVEALVAPVRGRPFVVFHDAYHYFEHRFDIEAVGSVSASDAVAPSAGRMAELQEAVVATGAACALTEPQFNPGLLSALGSVKLVEVDPLGARLTPGPALYGDLLRAMATSLATCLD